MNWESLIEKWLEDEERPVVVGKPATPEAFTRLSRFLEHDLPEEFVSLYSCHDGIGAEDEAKSDWQFVPLENLPSLITDTRKWFEESHPVIARGFCRFFDWGNGDAVGYLWNENNCLLPHLYEFSHEHYEFEVDQPWGEFLIEGFRSIEEFIIATT